ncbi:MAG: CHAT domain-containing protein, partial [Pyrinomonadaceae bacterium]
MSEEKLYLFVVTSKLTGKPERTLTTKLYDLGIGYKELVGRVLRFRQQIEQLDSATAQTSVELYDLLLKPAAEQLLNKSRLIIAPDSVLWGLSFQALMPAPERFLIEDVELFYVPSLTAYREIKNDTRPRVRAANTKQLVVFNHPTYSNQSTEFMQLMSGNNKLAQSLPDNESQPLSEVFGLRQSTLFSDTEASETRARSLGSAYRIIQFNAIARLEDASPMYSYVALSPDKNGGNDGFLLTREIMQLDERANLIIYSAASPVRDQIQNGDSLIGLSWAWFVAGSPALMTSQWITSPDCTT